MRKFGKKYQDVLKVVDTKKVYSIEEASSLVNKLNIAKFDATVTVSFSLGLNTKQADQQLRGALVLPNGSGITRKVLAITNKIDEALEAGADFAGAKDMIEKIKTENWFGYDVIVATPDMMGELGKLGKLLGPKGLMPNPKTGTVSPDIAKAIKEIKGGKVEYRTDKEGNLHVRAGKVSFEPKALAENVKTITDLVLKLRPATVKGVYVKNVVLAVTMGPSLKISIA